MAVKEPVIIDVSPSGDGSCLQVQWKSVTSANSCAAVSFPKHSDRSIQVAGTIGSSTTVLNGSNDGVTYAGLRDPSSTAISLAAAGIKAVLENTVFHQPSISGGDGTQSLLITMLFHLSNPMRT